MTANLKHHLVSAGLTFVATFLTTLGVALAAGTPESLTSAFVIGVIFTAGRAALKAASQLLINFTY